MEEKESITMTKPLYIKILVVSIILLIIYLAFVMSSFLFIKPYSLGAETSVDDQKIVTHIDVLEKDGKKLEIAGYAYEDGVPLETINSSFVIKNQETGKMYRMRTQMEDNINVPEDYRQAGIHAQCFLLGIPKGTYDIYVLYKNNNNDILTYTLISFDI